MSWTPAQHAAFEEFVGQCTRGELDIEVTDLVAPHVDFEALLDSLEGVHLKLPLAKALMRHGHPQRAAELLQEHSAGERMQVVTETGSPAILREYVAAAELTWSDDPRQARKAVEHINRFASTDRLRAAVESLNMPSHELRGTSMLALAVDWNTPNSKFLRYWRDRGPKAACSE